ncbi:CD151 antigen-like [Anthonomus grandis grandis]|uniref:CD151 antigen-like n=1 Tax=Anthonomus grandis grandis TaxID=2921223 RepID=UPI0021653C95|nr:CD151 antigen-like [Anthonomus grandis grandis]XP_050298777.1 CD151 antigen-like [Anthonomus grandis grandis]
MSSSEGCCRVSIIKAVLYAYQFVFVLTGIAIVTVGVWKYLETYHYFTVADMTMYSAILYLFITTGCLVICAFVFGFCAIPKNRTKLIFVFILVLVLVFLLESLVAILAYFYQQNVSEDVSQRLNSSFLENYNRNSKTDSVDFIQENLNCCGAQTFSDWKYSRWIKGSPGIMNKVPDSCCKTPIFLCGKSDHPSNIFYAGCEEKVALILRMSLWIMCAVSLGVSILQVVGVVFSIKLFLKLEAEDRNYNPRSNGIESLIPP